MNISQIELDITNVIENFNPETFIYDFLLAFGVPKASISRLQKGNTNLSKIDGEILWKKKLFYKVVSNDELYSTIDNYQQNLSQIKQDPRFIIVTDYQKILAIDTKTYESLDTELTNLDKSFDFFLPLAGMEKATYQGENPADVKAAEKMAKLFDELRADNPELSSPSQLHSLNVFLSRLLFCFFAEDPGIFAHKQFINAINNYTQADGSDVHEYMDKIFAVMNQATRGNAAEYIAVFPSVNGGLFRDVHLAPRFSRRSRQLLLDNGDLDWSVINPDIFGSMIQAVVDSKQRSGLGMHYTSVPNIMKVINPLFVDDLRDEFAKSRDSKIKLEKLLARISKIKIFDPACGSGNFLIIAYKELRALEITIIEQIDELSRSKSLGGKLINSSMLFSQINLSSFYGIEIDDFAHEIAKLSLWLAEHQMNMVFDKAFGHTAAALPLRDSGNIVCANACRIDWAVVCPKQADDEIYILGNPPYLGGKMQNKEQKIDFEIALQDVNYPRNLDYISIWFIKASNYILNKEKMKLAFVSTNSVCQGEHVELLWSIIFKSNIEIFFAHQSFKWKNSAKDNAGVSVVIIGLRNISNQEKTLFINGSIVVVSNINAYLQNAKNIIVQTTSESISKLNKMVFGCMARDNGGLFLTEKEKNELLISNPDASKFIKQIMGSQELLYKEKRYCLWIEEPLVEEACLVPFIKNRLESVRTFRAMSKAESTRKFADKPYRFVQISYKDSNAIIVPKVSSDTREYLQIDFISPQVIISDLAFAIYDAKQYLFGIISSKMHMLWVKTIGGRLGMGIRYSNTLCYNTFPFPPISEDQKKRIEMYVFEVLDEREKHSEKTLAELYDPDKMPAGLRQAHTNLDIAIEQCYRTKPFTSDEERLELLFTLYEQMKGY